MSYNGSIMPNQDDAQINPSPSICIKCGSTLLPDSHYCSLCGEPVKPLAEVPLTSPVTETPVMEESSPSASSESTPEPIQPVTQNQGYVPPPPVYKSEPSAMAKAALITGIISLFCCFIPAIVPIILGIIELNQINKGHSSPAGRSYALTGIVLGVVSIIMHFASYFFFLGLPHMLENLLKQSPVHPPSNWV